MGIELPQPSGEATNGTPNSERVAPIYGQEVRQSPSNNVEIKSTERPAQQEVRTAQPSGSTIAPAQQSAVTDTTISSDPVVTPASAPSLDDVPIVAADEDLIEKQWVDSIKRVIGETRTDPYQQGQAISRLQADYLQKRYGKIVGGSPDA